MQESKVLINRFSHKGKKNKNGVSGIVWKWFGRKLRTKQESVTGGNEGSRAELGGGPRCAYKKKKKRDELLSTWQLREGWGGWDSGERTASAKRRGPKREDHKANVDHVWRNYRRFGQVGQESPRPRRQPAAWRKHATNTALFNPPPPPFHLLYCVSFLCKQKKSPVSCFVGLHGHDQNVLYDSLPITPVTLICLIGLK